MTRASLFEVVQVAQHDFCNAPPIASPNSLALHVMRRTTFQDGAKH